MGQCSARLSRRRSSGVPTTRAHLHPISWTRIPLPSTLTSLSLSNDGMQLPSVSEFYNSFSELNALRDLRIVHWLPSSDDSTGLPLSPPPFALASLKAARVEDCSERVTRFFSIIRTPEIVSMNVTFSDSHISGIAIVECIENIRVSVGGAMENFQNISGVDLCHFDEKVRLGGPMSVDIRYEPLREIPSQHNLPHLRFHFSNQQLHFLEILTSLNRAFGFSTAKTLHVNSCKDIDPRLLLEMFSSSPKLRELVFTSTPVSGFFQEMGKDPAFQSDDLEPYFPALSSITLRSIRCADGEDWEGIDRDDATRSLWEGNLLECISTALSRRPDAYRVRKLVLKECKNLGQKDFGRLCGSMSSRTDVFWDGLESWGTRTPEVNSEDSSDIDLGPYDSDDLIF
ncbi:hypothetical protein FA13DRAFT_1451847 [Coprinellus micaceus]|uniref:F-box domain-containing protein n=1 Tax=Coprinellus micaceus TaxID=71717 RepID=A0A4Y7SMY1_COPMI|nr:hypothetical protein FA13DRAFT_1451847 [Coprinellus micaceus]